MENGTHEIQETQVAALERLTHKRVMEIWIKGVDPTARYSRSSDVKVARLLSVAAGTYIHPSTLKNYRVKHGMVGFHKKRKGSGPKKTEAPVTPPATVPEGPGTPNFPKFTSTEVVAFLKLVAAGYQTLPQKGLLIRVMPEEG
jgi:hypothetical protein